MPRPHVSQKYELGSFEREQLIADGYLHEHFKQDMDVWPILKAQGKDYCERMVVPYFPPSGYMPHTAAGFFSGMCECNDCLNGTGLEPAELAKLRHRQRMAKLKTIVQISAPLVFLLLAQNGGV